VHVPHARKDQRLRWDNQGIRNRVIRWLSDDMAARRQYGNAPVVQG
jgi:hypothetical protein